MGGNKLECFFKRNKKVTIHGTIEHPFLKCAKIRMDLWRYLECTVWVWRWNDDDDDDDDNELVEQLLIQYTEFTTILTWKMYLYTWS